MPDLQPGMRSHGSVGQDNLIGGTAINMVTMSADVNGGTTGLLRGALLGTITASGQRVLSTSAATDGSQNPTEILAEDVPAGTVRRTVVYQTGEFNVNAMTFGAGQTAEGVRAALRALNIHLKYNVPA